MVKLTREQIENWVAAHFQYKRHSNGRQLSINNPFTNDKDHHFWISTVASSLRNGPQKGVIGYWVHDWTNHGFNSSFIRFVMRYKKVSYYKAISEVSGKDKNSIQALLRSEKARRLQEKQEEIDDKKEFEVELPLSKVLSEDNGTKARQIAYNYVKGRCISDEVIESARLYYTPTSIVFPYYEFENIVFWQERDILDKIFRFPDSGKTGLNKTDYLYGFDNMEPHSDVIIVESIFNCLSVGNNCVATGGAILAGKQFQKLKALLPKTVILAPDFDNAGLRSLKSNYFSLRDKFKLLYAIPPEQDVDWNDLDRRDGIGSASNYISNHLTYLTIAKIVHISNRLKKVS
jgi:DNA primase